MCCVVCAQALCVTLCIVLPSVCEVSTFLPPLSLGPLAAAPPALTGRAASGSRRSANPPPAPDTSTHSAFPLSPHVQRPPLSHFLFCCSAPISRSVYCRIWSYFNLTLPLVSLCPSTSLLFFSLLQPGSRRLTTTSSLRHYCRPRVVVKLRVVFATWSSGFKQRE